MVNTKRLITSIGIIFIIFMTFFNSYKSVNFVFADDTVGNWQAVTTNEELADAFRYYCKSRDLTIEGSAADVVTSFTTQTFNNICRGLGIDITSLQAHLKKETDGSNVRYLFDSTGITAYNRIFSQFLQDNEIEVGDAVNDQTLYSGRYFVDADGHGCLVYVTNGSNYSDGNITASGTDYKYSLDDIISISQNSKQLTFHLTENLTFNENVVYWETTENNKPSLKINSSTSNINSVYTYYSNSYTRSGYHNEYKGKSSVLYASNSDKLYLVILRDYYYEDELYSANNSRYFLTEITNIPSNNNVSAFVFITTNNLTINNNNYEGDTIINPDGTPSTPSTPDPPTPDPPTPDPEQPDWDIDMPDLNINWILTGKENKFPWDIPFNIMFALSLLNAEPKTPEIEGNLNLGVYTWNYKLDLHQFDSVAEICRNFEFLAFLIGLMLMTKKLIWG